LDFFVGVRVTGSWKDNWRTWEPNCKLLEVTVQKLCACVCAVCLWERERERETERDS
jgi:phage baseplate assembly protein W